MFGLFGKPRGLMGGKPMTAQEAYGRPPVFQPPQQTPEPEEKGDGGRRIAGILGDFLLGLGGQQGVYGPLMQQQRLLDRRSQQQAQQAEAERMARREDFTFEHDYKRANPMPNERAPYRWEGNDGDVWELGVDGQPKRIFDDPTPKMNFIPDGMGGGQWVAVPGAAPASGLPQGYTKRPKGGPASAPGGFPR